MSAAAAGPAAGPRLIVTRTRSHHPLWVCLRAALVLVVWAPLPALVAAAMLYGAYQSALVETPAILEPPPGAATRVLSLDGGEVGGLQRGLAPWIRYDELPVRLVLAFLAAEDDEYFVHQGVDPMGIARAAVTNLRSGGIRQGGSTITQQVAKMFVGSARTYERKLVELLVARRIEAAYTKQEILECYLNRIYLGAGAQGVVAAARIYFDDTPSGLTLEELATLAGIASAPSAFEPYDHPDEAIRRRDYVLGRMEALGFVSAAAAEGARQAPLRMRERGEVPEPPLPYATDAVRADLTATYGRDVWRYGGLTVWISVSAILQRYAEEALQVGVETIDRRQGYRGPLRRGVLLAPETFDALVATRWPTGARWRPALVRAVGETRLEVRVDGLDLSLDDEAWAWAAPYDAQSSENDVAAESAAAVAGPGDVVLVERLAEADRDGRDGGGGRWRLTQVPRLEGALVSVDLDTSYINALVGGVDYDRSQFNRVTLGCRQPGSTFKPVIYSVALDLGRSLVTRLLDAPIQLRQGPMEVWRPRNSDADFRGTVSLRDGLILSRNLPTVRLFREVGVRRVVQRAEQLGFTTPMEPTDALSLGASCVLPLDMATAYGVFATGGYRRRPVLAVAAVDGRGTLVADSGAFYDAAAPASAVLHRAARAAREPAERVLDPRTAYLMRHVLADVVRLGTGHAASRIGVSAAGKTGTTNAYDAWFVGFTESVVTAVWIGSDRNTRALGRGETGSAVALPVWLAYSRRALDGRAQGDVVGEPPPGVALVRVDLRTGLLAQEGAPGAWLPFREGTEPTDFAPSPEQLDLMRIDRVDDRF